MQDKAGVVDTARALKQCLVLLVTGRKEQEREKAIILKAFNFILVLPEWMLLWSCYRGDACFRTGNWLQYKFLLLNSTDLHLSVKRVTAVAFQLLYSDVRFKKFCLYCERAGFEIRLYC